MSVLRFQGGDEVKKASVPVQKGFSCSVGKALPSFKLAPSSDLSARGM